MGESTVYCWGCMAACWLTGEASRVVVETGLWRRGRLVGRLVGVLLLAGCGQEKSARTCCCFLCSSNCTSRSTEHRRKTLSKHAEILNSVALIQNQRNTKGKGTPRSPRACDDSLGVDRSVLRTSSWPGSVWCRLLSSVFLTESSRPNTWARLLSTATSTRQESGIGERNQSKGHSGQSEQRRRLLAAGSLRCCTPFSSSTSSVLMLVTTSPSKPTSAMPFQKFSVSSVDQQATHATSSELEIQSILPLRTSALSSPTVPPLPRTT
ncbi:hypothetical protein EYF80_003581 [Liparis tanakae]|uniref:Uncharacterized protein n=1 Tax=Liparis tanakae TaxID=230148 RepID=A0A4Z2J8I3_9TELE|nr:hypothetical protein EYF80_003581 [Liparis tanakae]